MSEIEKMYINANVKDKNINNQLYKDLNYPQFTEKKQIFLIQWLLDKTDLYLHRHKTDFTYSIASGDIVANRNKKFKESIAEFINALWQDLTEEEKEQIRGILNG